MPASLSTCGWPDEQVRTQARTLFSPCSVGYPPHWMSRIVPVRRGLQLPGGRVFASLVGLVLQLCLLPIWACSLTLDFDGFKSAARQDAGVTGGADEQPGTSGSEAGTGAVETAGTGAEEAGTDSAPPVACQGDLSELCGEGAVGCWQTEAGQVCECHSTQVLNGAGRCRYRAWADPVRLEDLGGSAAEPRAAIDDQGVVMAGWVQIDEGTKRVWVTRREAEGLWEKAEGVDSSVGEAYGNIELTMNRAGVGAVLWSWVEGEAHHVAWSPFSAVTGGWGASRELTTLNPSVTTPRPPRGALLETGDHVALWMDDDENANEVVHLRYDGAGIVAREFPRLNADLPYGDIVAGGTGHALAAWVVQEDTRCSLLASVFSPEGWAVADVVAGPSTGIAQAPQLAMNVHGQAVVVWILESGGHRQVLARRFDPAQRVDLADGWLNESFALGSSTSTNILEPRVAINDGGALVAAWREEGQLFVRHGTIDKGWHTAAAVVSEGHENVKSAEIGLDSAGNAMAVWINHGEAGRQLWASHYISDLQSWQDAVALDAQAGGMVFVPGLAMNTHGAAVAAWLEDAGDGYNIWASVFE